MAYFANAVERYRIRFYGRSDQGPKDLKAWLYLYGPGHKTGVVGTIGFYAPDALAGKQDSLDGLGLPQGNMDIAEIGPILDMLRNEKPIHVHWSEIWQQVFLDTEKEPVGEEEA